MNYSDEILDKWKYYHIESTKLPNSKNRSQLIDEGVLTKEEISFIVKNYCKLQNHWLARHSERTEEKFKLRGLTK